MITVLKIEGCDLSPYLAQDLQWECNDLDSPKSGRSTMDGVMHRSVIGSKVKTQVVCNPVPETVTRRILPLLKQPFFLAEYLDPEYGVIEKEFYSSKRTCRLRQVYKDGHELWEGLSFPMIER